MVEARIIGLDLEIAEAEKQIRRLGRLFRFFRPFYSEDRRLNIRLLLICALLFVAFFYLFRPFAATAALKTVYNGAIFAVVAYAFWLHHVASKHERLEKGVEQLKHEKSDYVQRLEVLRKKRKGAGRS